MIRYPSLKFHGICLVSLFIDSSSVNRNLCTGLRYMQIQKDFSLKGSYKFMLVCSCVRAPFWNQFCLESTHWFFLFLELKTKTRTAFYGKFCFVQKWEKWAENGLKVVFLHFLKDFVISFSEKNYVVLCISSQTSYLSKFCFHVIYQNVLGQSDCRIFKV